MQLYTIDQVAKACEVLRKTLIYHHEWCGLAEPERIGKRFFYTDADLSRIKAYFAGREKYERVKRDKNPGV